MGKTAGCLLNAQSPLLTEFRLPRAAALHSVRLDGALLQQAQEDGGDHCVEGPQDDLGGHDHIDRVGLHVDVRTVPCVRHDIGLPSVDDVSNVTPRCSRIDPDNPEAVPIDTLPWKW